MRTTAPKTKEHQARWNEIVRDPALQDLPYKLETNEHGQILLSPHQNRHSFRQYDIQKLLEQHAPTGVVPPEFALATPKGVKAPDVVWMSPERREKIESSGDPTTRAPEICVEVMSDSNTWEAMNEKRALYLNAGAEEVWIVDADGQVYFFEEERMDESNIAPEFPGQIS
jgi:Uma2 family endonuclease